MVYLRPKPRGLTWRRDRQVGFSFGIDHKKAVLTFANAGCLNAFERRQARCSKRRSRLFMGGKAVGNSRLADFFRGCFGGEAQLLRRAGP